MTDNTYNGWTNYATWRVHLEMFDGRELEPGEIYGEPYQLGHELREQAEELICMDAPEGLDELHGDLAEVVRDAIAKAKEEA